MKRDIIKRVAQNSGYVNQLNGLREELQHLILQELDRKGLFKDMCFLGGTALRILFELDRFSEDLDFSTSSGCSQFNIEPVAKMLSKNLLSYGFENKITKLKSIKNVQSCFINFYSLKEFIGHIQKDKKLAIKIEIDTNPPKGAKETMSPITGTRLYKIRHYTLPSLFAEKMHALLFRQYTKGRDLYDYLWYMSKKVPVNIQLLENATEQSQGTKQKINLDDLKNRVVARFEKIDFKKARQDVLPFVKDEAVLSLFDKDLFIASVDRLFYE